MSIFRLPLFHDRRADRSKPVASVEFTEAELRYLAVAASHAAITGPVGWHHFDDTRIFDGLGLRLKRVADELRKADNANGAAPAGTGPRHDSLEVPR